MVASCELHCTNSGNAAVFCHNAVLVAAIDEIAQPREALLGAPASPVVELRDATVVYPGGNVGLDGVSLGVERGEFVFLVGATGCGKSTFIRLLMKEVEASRGQVLIAGRDITKLPRKKVPKLRRNIGVVFQDFKLLPNRTVYDNVAYCLQVIGESRSSIRAKVPEILRLVGLSTKLHDYPDELSGGEQQRVSLARAFVNHPPLLLADEPTGNLDSRSGEAVMELLKELHSTGATICMVTHDPRYARHAERGIHLFDGRVVDEPVEMAITS